MANPQKENGYVPIANELYDAMALFRIPGECEQILKVIIRKTYGYNKKEDSIANSQFVIATGMSKGNVSRALAKLIEHKVVIKSDNKIRTGNKYGLNKDYKEWIPFVIKSDNKQKKKKLLSKVKPLLSKVITPVIKSDNYLLSEVRDTKDKRQYKDTIQKTVADEASASPKNRTEQFFKGVDDLQNRIQTEESESMKIFLTSLMNKYPNSEKKVLWEEIQKFYRYWTELNHSGNKQRWQMQKTFMVERRLVTWLGNVKNFDVVKGDYKVENF